MAVPPPPPGWRPKLKGEKENLPENLGAQEHKGCAIKISLLPFTCLPCRLFTHACRHIHRNNSLPLKKCLSTEYWIAIYSMSNGLTLPPRNHR